MAFSHSTFEERIKAHLLEYLDPKGRLREKPKDTYIRTSSSSKGIEKIYTKNYGLSLFTSETVEGKTVLYSQVTSCFNYNELRFAQREDEDHHLFHQSTEDYKTTHTHLIKGRAEPELMSADEIKCIIDKIKKTEQRFGYCDKATNTPCLLDDSDSQTFIKTYQRHLDQRKIPPELHNQVNALYEKIRAESIAGLKSFTHAYLTTILDKYIKPLLITQGLYNKHATYFVETLKSAILAGLSFSMIATGLDILIRNTLTYGLTKLGLESEKIDALTSAIGTMTALTNNPFSLLEHAINGTAAITGQTLAYQTIRLLPKLKYEPENKATSQEKQDCIPHTAENDGSTYRRHINK